MASYACSDVTLDIVYSCMQDAAEKLGEDATQYKDTPVPMVEATKRIANMWTTKVQLLRSEVNISSHRIILC